jgi:hypothetical protein
VIGSLLRLYDTRVPKLDLYNLYTRKPAKKECPKSLLLKGYHTKECQDTTNYTSKNEEE